MRPSREGASAFDPRAALEARLDPTAPAGEEPAGAPADEVPEGRSRGLRIGTTVVWVVLAALAAVLRMCQEPR